MKSVIVRDGASDIGKINANHVSTPIASVRLKSYELL